MIPNNFWNLDRVKIEDKQFKSQLSLILKDFYNILNRGFIFQDNFRGTLMNVTLAVGENALVHNLQFVANNYILAGSSVANQSLYDSTTVNTKTTTYINAAQNGQARILVF